MSLKAVKFVVICYSSNRNEIYHSSSMATRYNSLNLCGKELKWKAILWIQTVLGTTNTFSPWFSFFQLYPQRRWNNKGLKGRNHKVCMLSHFSCVQLFANPWILSDQVPLSMGILQARILESVAIPFPPLENLPDLSLLHYMQIIYHWATWEANLNAVSLTRSFTNIPFCHSKSIIPMVLQYSYQLSLLSWKRKIREWFKGL